MGSKNKTGGMLTGVLECLSSWQMIGLLGALFVADLVFPDPIFMVDEMFLGLSTLLLARWRMRRKPPAAPASGGAQKPPPKNVTPDGPAAAE